jgi:hypothetical protein
MLTGQPPFFGSNRKELYENTITGEVIYPNYLSGLKE